MAKLIKSTLTTRVLKAIAMLGSAQCATIACSIIRVKLIAMWLGPAGTGLNSILYNASSLVSTATQLNLRDSAVRELSLPHDDEKMRFKTAVVRRWAFLIGIISALFMIVLSPFLSATAYGGSTSHTLSFAALSPSLFFTSYSSGEFAVMQARDRLRSIAQANVAAVIAATALSIPAIYFLGMKSIVIVINLYTLMLAIAARIWSHSEPTSFDRALGMKELWREGRGFLLLGLTISLSVMLTALMNYVFSAYINTYGGEAALGIYQSGYTLVGSYVGIIFSAITIEYYPRLTRCADRPRVSRIVMSHELLLIVRLITPIAIIFISCSQFIVRILYSSMYEAITPYIVIAIIGAIFQGASFCYSYRILAAGDSKAFITTEAISIAVGLTLYITGYNYWSYTGLGVAYVIWYIFYTFLTAAVCRRRYSTSLPSATWITLAASTIICMASIILWKYVAWWMPLVTTLPLWAVLSIRKFIPKR